MELIPDIKLYEWGKLGNDSEVANLAKLNSTSKPIDSCQPYAEWWMGDHVSGPSTVKASGETLSSVFARNPTLIGGSERLPFLLKVLSIGKALSIQVHPSKVTYNLYLQHTRYNKKLFYFFRKKLSICFAPALICTRILIINQNLLSP